LVAKNNANQTQKLRQGGEAKRTIFVV